MRQLWLDIWGTGPDHSVAIRGDFFEVQFDRRCEILFVMGLADKKARLHRLLAICAHLAISF